VQYEWLKQHQIDLNPLNATLNPICHLLALLGAHHIFHVSGLRVKSPGTWILCLWIRASLIYINKCPTRCNTKQSIYYSASSLYMFRVSTTPIIKSTQNCTTVSGTGHVFCAAVSLQCGQAWPRWREVAAQYRRL